jgi:hypothetical protein
VVSIWHNHHRNSGLHVPNCNHLCDGHGSQHQPGDVHVKHAVRLLHPVQDKTALHCGSQQGIAPYLLAYVLRFVLPSPGNFSVLHIEAAQTINYYLFLAAAALRTQRRCRQALYCSMTAPLILRITFVK